MSKWELFMDQNRGHVDGDYYVKITRVTTVKIIHHIHAFKMSVPSPKDPWWQPEKVHTGGAKVIALCIELLDLSVFINAITGLQSGAR